MPPEQSNPTQEELQWLNDFLAAHAAELAQTSGAEAARNFAKAMGGATPEIQQAWLESEPSAVEAAATQAAEQAGGETPQAMDGAGEDFEAIAERIYSKALGELSDDGPAPADAELDGIWQDARNVARTWTPKTEDDLVDQVVNNYLMKIVDEVSADELYEIITGFTDDIKRLIASASES